jgi:UDP-N-acetylglucosamine acyltransferase
MSARIHPTAVVDPAAELGDNVTVGPYCVIGANVRVGAGTQLHSHVVLDGWTELGAECSVYPFASIGTRTQDLKYRGGKTYVKVGSRTTLREYVTVNSGTQEEEVTTVGDDCLLMAHAHVAHGCRVGNEVIMANCGTLAGHVVMEDQSILGGLSGIHQFVKVGRLCIIGGCAKVTKDCPPFMLVDGNPAEVHGINSVGLTRHKLVGEAQSRLKAAHRILYRENLAVHAALERIRSELGTEGEVGHLVRFIEESERGILR